MSLVLYGVPLSPFVRKVRLALLEKGLDYQLEFVMPFAPPAWYFELNPLGRIPTLKDGDLVLADSSVICQYLDDCHPHGIALLGHPPEERARVRWLEKYADYEIAPYATFGVFRNRIVKPSAGQRCDEEAVRQALEEVLPKHFDYLDRQLGERSYFVGEEATLADFAITCQLINLEHGGETLDPARWPRLAAHFERMKARQSVQSLLPAEQRMVEKLRTSVSGT
ncbi:glutathione S-transferase family protein [Stutzerimonas azotifigens]|uniref:glutathione S-transferase family protein n=1 Tax=Stutzerimonas azotifigens TaxID=291995 RepID=UPI00041559F0|nr:glutathione S-transferase family protein [Stutzerimonas azotifigens]